LVLVIDEKSESLLAALGPETALESGSVVTRKGRSLWKLVFVEQMSHVYTVKKWVLNLSILPSSLT
jgi:hypothetical protein